MLELIKIDIKNCINNLRFKIIFLSILGISLISFFSTCATYYGKNSLQIYSTNKMSLILSSDLRSVFHFLILTIPMLACIIYSDSYIIERKNNITNYFFIRSSRIKYFISKILVIFCTVFSTIFLVLIINELLTYTAIPKIGVNTGYGIPIYQIRVNNNEFFLQQIYNLNPYVYNIILITISAIYGALIAVIAFNISLIIRMKPVTLIIGTFLIVNLISIILPMNFRIELYIQSWPGNFKDFLLTFCIWIVALILTGVIGIVKECKY